MNAPTALRLANASLALALAAKARLPGDVPEDHEDNTYGLPGGRPIARALRRFFREQLKRIVGFVQKLGAEIPASFPRLADYDDPMASAMTPILGVYWDRAGRALNGRLGLDPDEWRVTDPNLHRAIAQQSFKFCQATNATTDRQLAAALADLRRELHEGLVGRGETIPQLTRRVQAVFARASKERARMIAQTEASRAVHTASEMSAIASGVVSAKRLLLSANSCPVCVRVAEEARAVPLGGSFGTVGRSAEYSDVRMPPIHPHCRCSVAYDLAEEDARPVPAFVPGPEGGHPAAARGFGRSRARLEYDSAADTAAQSGMLRDSRDHLGIRLGLADAASLAGAPDDAKFSLERDPGGAIAVKFTGGAYEANRYLDADADGRRVVLNKDFYVDAEAQGKGLGMRVFGRQVENAIRLGFDRIETTASAGGGDNGYYTWPRFGYDAPLEDPARYEKIPERPPGLAGATTISDLMATPEGRAWWRENGVTVDMTFDLTKGSRSLRIWEAYLAEKRGGIDGT